MKNLKTNVSKLNSVNEPFKSLAYWAAIRQDMSKYKRKYSKIWYSWLLQKLDENTGSWYIVFKRGIRLWGEVAEDFTLVKDWVEIEAQRDAIGWIQMVNGRLYYLVWKPNEVTNSLSVSLKRDWQVIFDGEAKWYNNINFTVNKDWSHFVCGISNEHSSKVLLDDTEYELPINTEAIDLKISDNWKHFVCIQKSDKDDIILVSDKFVSQKFIWIGGYWFPPIISNEWMVFKIIDKRKDHQFSDSRSDHVLTYNWVKILDMPIFQATSSDTHNGNYFNSIGNLEYFWDVFCAGKIINDPNKAPDLIYNTYVTMNWYIIQQLDSSHSKFHPAKFLYKKYTDSVWHTLKFLPSEPNYVEVDWKRYLRKLIKI
jgi:hypothetical protein